LALKHTFIFDIGGKEEFPFQYQPPPLSLKKILERKMKNKIVRINSSSEGAQKEIHLVLLHKALAIKLLALSRASKFSCIAASQLKRANRGPV
jgi:hypothetical protein